MTNRSQATYAHNLSEFSTVSTGVQQGSILGPILFLLFINDLPLYVKSCNLYADDTMTEQTGKSVDEIIPKMQNDINNLHKWFTANKLKISPSKSCCMLIGSHQKMSHFMEKDSIGLFIDGVPLKLTNCYKYLGLNIDNTLTWNSEILSICKKLRCKTAALQRICKFIPASNANILYFSFIQCHIDYCLSIWGHTSSENLSKLQRVQNRVARIVSNNFDYENVSGKSLVIW